MWLQDRRKAAEGWVRGSDAGTKDRGTEGRLEGQWEGGKESARGPREPCLSKTTVRSEGDTMSHGGRQTTDRMDQRKPSPCTKTERKTGSFTPRSKRIDKEKSEDCV